MERKTAADFDPQVLILFDAYVHGALDRRGFLDKAAKYAVGGVTASMLLEQLNPKFAEAQQVAKDDARLKAEYVEFASPQGYGKMQGLSGAAGQGRRQAAGRAGRAREPRAEPAHRGHRPARRPRQLRGLRARRADAAGRLPRRRRGRGPRRSSPSSSSPRPARTWWRRPGSSSTHAECTGKLGVVGFCYGGGICNFLATRVPELVAAVPFYGGPPAGRGRAEDQGPDAHPLRRHRRAHQRRLAGLRGGAQGRRREVRDAHVPGHAARLQQRHHAALRQGRRGRRRGSARWRSSTARCGRSASRRQRSGPARRRIPWRAGSRRRVPARQALEGTWCRLEPLDPDRHARPLFEANASTSRAATGPTCRSDRSPASTTTTPGCGRWRPARTRRSTRSSIAPWRVRWGWPATCASIRRPARSRSGTSTSRRWRSARRAATEAMYLMMREAFALGYRRYEWKCDALNAPSRAAAERLGFTFEGIFRQATVYKGRNRDTAWYSIVDREFPALDRSVRSVAAIPTTSTPADVSGNGCRTWSRRRGRRKHAEQRPRTPLVTKCLGDSRSAPRYAMARCW